MHNASRKVSAIDATSDRSLVALLALLAVGLAGQPCLPLILPRIPVVAHEAFGSITSSICRRGLPPLLCEGPESLPVVMDGAVQRLTASFKSGWAIRWCFLHRRARWLGNGASNPCAAGGVREAGCL